MTEVRFEHAVASRGRLEKDQIVAVFGRHHARSFDRLQTCAKKSRNDWNSIRAHSFAY
jgi:hypothetical protein